VGWCGGRRREGLPALVAEFVGGRVADPTARTHLFELPAAFSAEYRPLTVFVATPRAP